MTKKADQFEKGLQELRDARRKNRPLFWVVGLFSAFANLLMMTGPLYMLQVYDRVLSSRSVETLVALTGLVTFLYAVMGILDFTRGRILARIGARFQQNLEGRVFNAKVGNTLSRSNPNSQNGLADLDALYRYYCSSAATVGFDLPWIPIFLFGIALFHPWLGYLAFFGCAAMVGLTILNQMLSATSANQANESMQRATSVGDQYCSQSESIQSLGAQGNAFQNWKSQRNLTRDLHAMAADLGGGFASLIKAFRLFLQSAMLGLGAYLVLQGELSAGAMIAGSILMGRALAPIELAIGQWPAIQNARSGWWNLAALLTQVPEYSFRTKLPKPKARLDAKDLTIVPPGQTRAAIRLVNFAVEPGQALGVIGPSGSGKSSLARAIIGVWNAAGGKLRLDGASLDQYAPSEIGTFIGYLPQNVQIFDGSIAENIARLSDQPNNIQVVEAAKRAGAHELILSMPKGYETRVSAANCALSEGQIRQIGLARALYSDPLILLLDEPSAGLDHNGTAALFAVIRQHISEGKSVVMMSNRPTAIQNCDLILALKEDGSYQFGTRDDVLRKTVANFQEIQLLRRPGQN